MASSSAARVVLGRAGSHEGDLAGASGVDLDRHERVSAGVGGEGVLAGADEEVGLGKGHVVSLLEVL